MTAPIQRKPNRLIHEKSPYLLQHAYNPVDWFSWSQEAFDKARQEDKPIFLSIGYSTCHWCHVMERECFEDDEVADILNKNFIAIKVDREERPDIDNIYMSFCQMMTGSGGWPMTIVMTPEQKPFFAGTYFPKRSSMNMPGLIDILLQVIAEWNENKHDLVKASGKFVDAILPQFYIENGGVKLTRDIFTRAYESLVSSFDDIYGGFGSAPKFPTPQNLYFLLRYYNATGQKKALDMAEKTLESMYRGGIFDHIDGGFCRYSTDRKWLVPHFEKMLYDNALLVIAYTECYQATRKNIYAQAVRRTLRYIIRDMTDDDGGFYSAMDADSEGVEGKFYLWDIKEIQEILGDSDARSFCDYYGMTEKGNFNGKNIPNRINGYNNLIYDEDYIRRLREKVFQHRIKRISPYKDDKTLTGWNGLMIAAMSIAGRVLDDEIYVETAERAAQFILNKMIREDGRLLARYRQGEAAYLAYSDDYAYFILGLMEIYEATYNPTYLEYAIRFSDDMVKYFWDERNGGFFLYGNDSEKLLVRPKELYDGALPSGNSVAAYNFLRLSKITNDKRFEQFADRQISLFEEAVDAYPIGYTYFLSGLMFKLYPSNQVILSGSKKDKQLDKMKKYMGNAYLPQWIKMVYYVDDEWGKSLESMVPDIKWMKAVNGQATAYICRDFVCKAPTTDYITFINNLS